MTRREKKIRRWFELHMTWFNLVCFKSTQSIRLSGILELRKVPIEKNSVISLLETLIAF